MQTRPIIRFAPLAALAASAGVRRDGAGFSRFAVTSLLVRPGVLAEYLIHARRVCAAASIDLLCAVLPLGAAFFIPQTLQRRYVAV